MNEWRMVERMNRERVNVNHKLYNLVCRRFKDYYEIYIFRQNWIGNYAI